MRTAAVTTFPGHFLLTKLSIDHYLRNFPDTQKLYVVYDDADLSHWPEYVSDCKSLYESDVDTEYVSFSDLNSDIKTCKIGWYRQQLAKCYLDVAITDETWFSFDGDILFDKCVDQSEHVPVQQFDKFEYTSISVMVKQYLCTVLGIEQSPLQLHNNFRITSSIPFRTLDKKLLQDTRSWVERVTKKDFAKLHIDWVHDQQLIVYDDQPTAMIMHEWELIEAVRILTRPYTEIKASNSGYELYMDTTDCHEPRYRHGYVKDDELDTAWLDQQIVVDPAAQARSRRFLHAYRNSIINQCI